MGFLDRLQHSWNAFMNKDPTQEYRDYGMGNSQRPDRPRLTRGNERTIVTAIVNRIALDVSGINIKHCKLDDNGRYLEDINSPFNNCLNLEANIDQTGRAFMHDAVMSMLDEGVVALVPIDTSINPMNTASYDILSIRTAKIIEWYPRHVKVRVYNDRTGNKEEKIMPKDKVAIVENPLYAIINEPNSTMQRLIRKLSLMDIVDEQSSAGKLDLIIQLPYVIKSEARRQQADARRKDIEMQLSGSKYGIAYTDGTERITQLNRPLENNLLKQIEYLTSMLYSQLGFHQTILDGTADEKTMLNYTNRILEPIISAFVDEMKRKFLTKTARSQNQTIMFFSDPFKLVPVNDIAEIADKFTRNEIMTSNEIRQIVGMKPSKDPKADQLINSNINQSDARLNELDRMTSPDTGMEPTQESQDMEVSTGMSFDEYKHQIKDLDNFDKQLDQLEGKFPRSNDLKHYASPYYDPVKAHEYYMKTRELKGRKSTSTLNDEGKAAAAYVKEQLDTERKTKVEESRTAMNSQLDASKNSTNAQIKSKQEAMNTDLENRKNKMSNEKARRREQISEKVESHRKEATNKIESLRKQLDSMTMEEWNSRAESIMKDIDNLRKDNANIREKLEAEYSEYSSKLSSEYSTYSDSAKKKVSDEKTKLREEHKTSSDKLRSDHKTEVNRLKDEYNEKYISELDKIKSNEKYLKPSKKKKTTSK